METVTRKPKTAGSGKKQKPAPTPDTAVAQVPAIIPPDQLAALNITDVALDKMLEKAKTLTANDKESYDITHEFCMVAMRTRTGLKKLGDALLAPKKEEIKTITTELDRITARIVKAEGIARPIKLAYETKQEQLRQEREEAAACKILDRTQSAINLGMEWNGINYTLGPHVIEAVQVKAAPDEDWDKLLLDVTAYRNTELLRIQAEQEAAEIKRLADEVALEEQREQQRQQQLQLDADAKKLQDEIDAFERQKAELENTRLQAVADENTRLDRIKTDALKIRLQRLADLGIPITRGRVLTLGDLRYEVADIKEADETTFETIYQAFVETGITLADAQRIAEEQQAALDLKKKQQEEADEAARIKADTERTERLAPDVKLFTDFLDQWDCQADLPLQQPEVRELARVFNDRIKMVVDSFKDAITTL